MPRREKRRFTNFLLSVIVDGDEFYRLSVADRDRSGLVKDDHIRISCSLNCSSRLGYDLSPVEAGNPRKPNRREQRPDCCWEETDIERDKDGEVHRKIESNREAEKCNNNYREYGRQTNQYSGHGHLVRRPRSLRGLYQPNHLADVSILRVHRDPSGESIADHSRSPDDLVPRRLPDGCRFSR